MQTNYTRNLFFNKLKKRDKIKGKNLETYKYFYLVPQGMITVY